MQIELSEGWNFHWQNRLKTGWILKKKVPRAFLANLWSKFRASGKEGVSRADEEVWKDCAWYLM